MIKEPFHPLFGKFVYHFEASGAVRCPCIVAEVNEVVRRKLVQQGSEDVESSVS